MRSREDEIRAQIQGAAEAGNQFEVDRLRAMLEPEAEEPEDEAIEPEPLYGDHELPPEPEVGPADDEPDEPERPAPPDHE